MKKYLVITLTSLISLSCFAGNIQPFEFLGHPLEATMNASSLVSTDTPLPMTRFDKGEWRFGINPVYFTIDQAYFETGGAGGGALFNGDDLSGFGGNVSVSYGITDRWQVYGLFSGVNMEGKINGRIPGTAPSDQFFVDGKNFFWNLSAGLGYEHQLKNPNWSSSVYFGFSLRGYKTDLISNPIPGSGSNDPDTLITGSGINPGISLGYQATYRLYKNFSLSPYVFGSYTFSDPELQIEVTDTNGNSGFSTGQSINGEIQAELRPIIGLNFGYIPWGLSINIAGLLTSLYSDQIYSGLEMTKIAIQYSWGQSSDSPTTAEQVE